MKLLVLFGSKSDEPVYTPLVNKLKGAHVPEFHILSAHRQPDELDAALRRTDARAVVAGAGLAAHLPGVVASKVTLPVFGVPVASNYAGLDALLSIQQMPFGVPVLACAPGCEDAVVRFLDRMESRSAPSIQVVPNGEGEHIDAELARLQAFADETSAALSVTDSPREGLPAIVFVQREEDIRDDAGTIHVPLLDAAKKKDARAALEVFAWTARGGLWVGVNNSRNALIFFQKTRRKDA